MSNDELMKAYKCGEKPAATAAMDGADGVTCACDAALKKPQTLEQHLKQYHGGKMPKGKCKFIKQWEANHPESTAKGDAKTDAAAKNKKGYRAFAKKEGGAGELTAESIKAKVEKAMKGIPHKGIEVTLDQPEKGMVEMCVKGVSDYKVNEVLHDAGVVGDIIAAGGAFADRYSGHGGGCVAMQMPKAKKDEKKDGGAKGKVNKKDADEYLDAVKKDKGKKDAEAAEIGKKIADVVAPYWNDKAKEAVKEELKGRSLEDLITDWVKEEQADGWKVSAEPGNFDWVKQRIAHFRGDYETGWWNSQKYPEGDENPAVKGDKGAKKTDKGGAAKFAKGDEVFCTGHRGKFTITKCDDDGFCEIKGEHGEIFKEHSQNFTSAKGNKNGVRVSEYKGKFTVTDNLGNDYGTFASKDEAQKKADEIIKRDNGGDKGGAAKKSTFEFKDGVLDRLEKDVGSDAMENVSAASPMGDQCSIVYEEGKENKSNAEKLLAAIKDKYGNVDGKVEWLDGEDNCYRVLVTKKSDGGADKGGAAKKPNYKEADLSDFSDPMADRNAEQDKVLKENVGGALAKACEGKVSPFVYLTKGGKLAVTGSVGYNSHEGKWKLDEDGEKEVKSQWADALKAMGCKNITFGNTNEEGRRDIECVCEPPFKTYEAAMAKFAPKSNASASAAKPKGTSKEALQKFKDAKAELHELLDSNQITPEKLNELTAKVNAAMKEYEELADAEAAAKYKND